MLPWGVLSPTQISPSCGLSIKENVFGDCPYGNPDQQLLKGNLVYQPVFTLKNGDMVYRDVTF